MTISTTLNRAAVILLVEDNDNDVELTKLGFAHCGLDIALHHVANGEECMRYLNKTDQYSGAPTPDLILLDLHMPRMNGIEVLKAKALDEQLQRIPVVVLTTSDAPADMAAAYRAGCNSYVIKPTGFEAFAKVLEALGKYWLQLVALPTSTTPVATTQPRTGHKADESS